MSSIILYVRLEEVILNFKQGYRKCLVLYYGWLVKNDKGEPSRDAVRIASSVKDGIVIVNAFTSQPKLVNLSPHVLQLMRRGGNKIIAYISTGWCSKPLSDVMSSVEDCITLGVDGFFLDEVASLRYYSNEFLYYAEVYDFIKYLNPNLLVILNPGVGVIDEDIMQVADILSLENQWRRFVSSSIWRHRYDAGRFMGLSTSVSNVGEAIAATEEAWSLGIGLHYSTYQYIKLEEWFEEYISGICRRF